MIEVPPRFSVQLNGSGRAEISISLSSFAGEELDI